MKSTLLTLTFIWFTTISTFAASKATGSIGGKFNDDAGQPVAFATIMLLNKDSVLVKADFSKEDGTFNFENVDAGVYKVQLSSVQYESYTSEIFTLEAGQKLVLQPFKVAEKVQQLAEVKVVATKPLVEVHPDKTTFNVASSPNTAGTDALEMLKKAPGVVVDNNDNIMLQGKSGVKIYIDGKPSRLSGEDLVNMLRSMQSDGVEAVDLITNPSAKYDAEGNAGIIDIKLKRDKNLGLKATVNAGYNIGKFYRYQSGIDYNYRNKNLNVFGNYNYFNHKGFSNEGGQKLIKDYFMDLNSMIVWNPNGHNYRLGADYMINKKHLVGFVVNGNLTDITVDINTHTPFGKIETGITEEVLDASSFRNMNINNINSNVNYVYTGDKGAKINVDADYGRFYKDGGSEQSNIYKAIENGNILMANYSADDQTTKIEIKAFKTDYEKAIGGGTLAFGGKLSEVKSDNSFKYFNVIENNRILNTNKSNDFIYTERIGAAYATYNGKLNSKLTYNVGLRTEMTNSDGLLESVQNNNDSRVERSYADLFPSGGIAYQMNKKNKFAVNYSRRIDRPNYESLNPFEFQLDELTFRKGNPFLNPQYTNSYKLTHSFNHKLNTQLSYSKTNDFFAQILDTISGKGGMISVQNMASSQNIGMNVNYSMDITKKWSFYTNINFYKNYFKSGIPGKDINLDMAAVNVYAKTNIILPADINFEVSGWYNSPTVWGGTFKMEEMWSMDAGIRKPFWDKRASFKASVSDIFKTSNWRGKSAYGGISYDASGHHDSRQLRLSFTYNIGNQQVKGSRNRSTGLDEEKNRLGGGEGQN